MSPLRRASALALCGLAVALLGAQSGGGCGGTSPYIAFDGGSSCAPFAADGGSSCAAASLCDEPNDEHQHLDVGTPIVYPSNPPAGGPHWPVWAIWGVHDNAVPVEYLVHNEEHGGVILFYNLAKCADGCPNLVADLKAFMAAQPQDPVCTAQAPGVLTRMVLSPDPDLDVVWAAATWGWAYKSSSSCVDAAALQQFADQHYAQGSEDYCYQGLYN